jgi:hypothetical protein
MAARFLHDRINLRRVRTTARIPTQHFRVEVRLIAAARDGEARERPPELSFKKIFVFHCSPSKFPGQIYEHGPQCQEPRFLCDEDRIYESRSSDEKTAASAPLRGDTVGIATGGTAARSPARNPCLISLRIVRRFSKIVFSQAERPICGK